MPTEYPPSSASAPTSTSCSPPTGRWRGPGGSRPSRRAPADADRAGGRGHRVPGPGALRQGRERMPEGAPQRPLRHDDQDHAGPVTLERPKLRGTTEAFASRLFGTGVTRTNALESLVIASFVRGCRSVTSKPPWPRPSATEAALSKSTVSRICEAIKDEFEAWASRDLSGVTSTTCSWTAATSSSTRFPVRAGAGAWGITTEGQAGVRWPGPGRRESTTPGPGSWPTWKAGVSTARCWSSPTVRPGLIGAVEQVSPQEPPPAVSHPPGEEHPRQGAQAGPVRDEGRVLEALRRTSSRPARGRRRSSTPGSTPSPRKWQPLYPRAVECLTTDRAA